MIIQVPTVVLAGALLFWNLGLSWHSHHSTALAGVVTGVYAVLGIAVIVWMQWSVRSRARRLAREGAATSSSGA